MVPPTQEEQLKPVSQAQDPLAKARARVRWPVFVLGTILIPVNSLWIARAEGLDYSGFPTCASLFYNVLFVLMVLLLVNLGLRRIAPRLALNRAELLIIYAMTATGSSLVGHDTMQMLVPSVPHAAHFATPENRWAELILPQLPDWLTIKNAPQAMAHYEQGHSTLYTWDHIKPWLLPVGAWSGFLVAFIATILAANVIVHRHWTQHERLTYPIVQIPLMITEGGGVNSLFSNRLLWLGFAIAASLDLLNGLALFFPSLPTINTKQTDLTYLFQGNPLFAATGWTHISFYPFVIGLSYFMPTNMAFSTWFFFFFRKGIQISAAALGYQPTHNWFPYLKEQSFGALIVLFSSTLWFGRKYFKEIAHAALAGIGEDGGISYRFALAVLALGVLGMTAFLAAAGMWPWLALVYIVLYLLFCGALARIRAELGSPAHEMGWVGTSYILMGAIGTSILRPKNLAVFSLLYFQNRMHRGILMPQQTECLKAADESGIRTRTMAAVLMWAGFIGVLSAFWALIHLGYARGYPSRHPGAPGSAFSNDAVNQLASWLLNPVHSDHLGIAAVLIGAAVAAVLAKFNSVFQGFPFHPAGYAIGMSFGIDYIWMPVMISWLAKVLVLRYSGLRGYRASMPFFIGLVLGEFTVGGLWSFVRGVIGVQTYTFFY